MNRRDFFISLLKTTIAAAAAPTLLKLAGAETPWVIVRAPPLSFAAMLNLYMPMDLLKAELERRDFMLEMVVHGEGYYKVSWDDEMDA